MLQKRSPFLSPRIKTGLPPLRSRLFHQPTDPNDGTLRFSESSLQGHFTFYYKSGRISSEGAYQHNEKTGIWKYYDSLGKIRFSENFLKGKRQGETLLYYPEGSVKRKEIYVDGKLSTGNCYTRSGQDTTYFAQSEEASFIGGQEALNSYIQENMRYPMGAVLRGIEGKVYVRFMINSNGQVKKIKIIKSAHRIFN